MVDKVQVTNKSTGLVFYKIPNGNGGVRTFYAHQTQNVSTEELIMLSQQPGGMELFYNYLDPEVIRAILHMEPEPEYWLTEDQIPNWMKTSSLDEFIDALNFAPKGTRDIIKKIAVEQELNDNNKREAIKEILGFDVTAAIENSGADEVEDAQKSTVTRRVQAPAAASPTRRTTQTKIIIPKSE